MIVRDPYWMERDDVSQDGPNSFWVDLDKPRHPFGFAAPKQPDQPKAKPKKKRKKDKRS